jgi:hypothetical protein
MYCINKNKRFGTMLHWTGQDRTGQCCINIKQDFLIFFAMPAHLAYGIWHLALALALA